MFDKSTKAKQTAFKSIYADKSEQGSCKIPNDQLDRNISYYVRISLSVKFRDPDHPGFILQDLYTVHLKPPFRKDHEGNEIRCDRRVKEYLCCMIKGKNGYYNISFHQEPSSFRNNMDSIVQELEQEGIIW